MNEDNWNERAQRHPNRSLFWPIILIGVGLIWLLANLGLVGTPSIWLALRLWPALLIVIGLDLLFGSRRPIVGTALGLVTVAAVVLLVALAPSLGWTKESGALLGLEMRTEQFSEPLGEASRARVELHLSRWPTTIQALRDSGDLINATLDCTGAISFDASESAGRKTVSLSHRDAISNLWTSFGAGDYAWDIGLSPRVPLDLLVDVGSGPLSADLSHLDLLALELDGGSGPSEVTLPEPGHAYHLDIDVASGRVRLAFPDQVRVEGKIKGGSGPLEIEMGTNTETSLEIDGSSGPNAIFVGANSTVKLVLDGGSGSSAIDIPDGMPLRVEVRDGGSGSLDLPSWVSRVSGDEGEDEGVWETSDYAAAEDRVTITLNIGSGSVHLR